MVESQSHPKVRHIESGDWASALDDADYRIVLELQKDARTSNRKLARFTGLSQTAVGRRITKLLNSGMILLTAIPDHVVFGYPVVVWFQLEVEISRIDEVVARLCSCANVIWIMTCIGTADIIVRGMFRSNESLAKFETKEIGQIAGILQINTMMELRQVKRTSGRLEEAPLIPKLIAGRKATPVFDDIDYRLIFELQKNARASSQELAQVIPASGATINRRIKRLVNSGSIALTSVPICAGSPMATELGTFVRCIVGLKIDLAHLDAIVEKLATYFQVSILVIVSGTTKILVLVTESSIKRLEAFVTCEVSKITGVIRADTFVQVKVHKYSFDWLEPNLLSSPY